MVETAIAAIGGRPALESRMATGVTEIIKLEGRGHALTIDNGWCAVAEATLNFVSRVQPPKGAS